MAESEFKDTAPRGTQVVEHISSIPHTETSAGVGVVHSRQNPEAKQSEGGDSEERRSREYLEVLRVLEDGLSRVPPKLRSQVPDSKLGRGSTSSNRAKKVSRRLVTLRPSPHKPELHSGLRMNRTRKRMTQRTKKQKESRQRDREVENREEHSDDIREAPQVSERALSRTQRDEAKNLHIHIPSSSSWMGQSLETPENPASSIRTVEDHIVRDSTRSHSP